MERGSDNHSPILDEALKHDTASIVQGGRESRSDEFREQEGPAEGEPTPDALIKGGGEIPAPDQLYENVAQLWEALGGRNEHPRHHN